MSWDLPEIVVGKSISDNFSQAKLEWGIIDYRVESNYTCACGHHPIRIVCRIRNNVTGNELDIGRCCAANHFERVFDTIRSLEKLNKDISKSVTRETLDAMYEENIILLTEYNFYNDIIRKRKLSQKMKDWKISINKKIIGVLK